MKMTDISLRGCLVVTVGCLFGLYQFYMQASPGFIVPQLMDDLSLNRAQTGVLASSILYSYILLQLPAGWLIDRYGVKAMFLLCQVLMVGGTLLFSHAASLEMAIAGRMLQGAGSASAIVGALCLAAAWFPARLFPVFVGLVEMSAMLGGAVSSSVIPELTNIMGWRYAMLISAGFGGLLWLCMLFISNRPRSVASESIDAHGHPVEGGDLRRVFGSVQVWLSATYGFGLFGLISVFGMMWGASFLECLYPFSHAFAANGMTLLFVGVAVGTVLCGWVIARGGTCRNWMILGASLSLLLLLAIIFLPVASVIMAVLLFLLGMAMGSYGLAFVAPGESLPQSGLGLAIAFINVCLLVAGQILQPLLGSILDIRAATQQLGIVDYQIAFIPLLVLAVMALLASLKLKEA
ncbi:MFS transporter [Parendozoicomonas sp. Alg238-R29]|uniref:MFS transporter n=1 Tax=Parendozoicomonas sp. Alg238-R29 TaxID=2993446 RepID=UPI00248F292C|nr:MFS transporter [Parendozoicomonas sp. Alg238-R29]